MHRGSAAMELAMRDSLPVEINAKKTTKLTGGGVGLVETGVSGHSINAMGCALKALMHVGQIYAQSTILGTGKITGHVGTVVSRCLKNVTSKKLDNFMLIQEVSKFKKFRNNICMIINLFSFLDFSISCNSSVITIAHTNCIPLLLGRHAWQKVHAFC